MSGGKNNELAFESRVEGIIITKVRLVVGLLVFVIPLMAAFFKIQMDVALIKQNHMSHLEEQNRRIEELEQKYTELKEQDSKTLEFLGTYNSKLDQLIGLHNASLKK